MHVHFFCFTGVKVVMLVEVHPGLVNRIRMIAIIGIKCWFKKQNYFNGRRDRGGETLHQAQLNGGCNKWKKVREGCEKGGGREGTWGKEFGWVSIGNMEILSTSWLGHGMSWKSMNTQLYLSCSFTMAGFLCLCVNENFYFEHLWPCVKGINRINNVRESGPTLTDTLRHKCAVELDWYFSYILGSCQFLTHHSRLQCYMPFKPMHLKCLGLPL